jgi:MoaA/NifB/PqqE/SkfB family radical SAM enzyme
MKKYLQEAPFAVQVELAEGCNLRCSFCGLSGIRGPKDREYKCMTEKTLRSLMRQIVEAKWNPRVEFAMHGEPTMHHDYVSMVRAAREEAPKLQLMMTSNGGGLLRRPGPLGNVTALFDAGLDVLALDDYRDAKIVPKIREAWRARPSPDVRSYEYPADKEGSPHARRHHKALIFIEAIDVAETGNHATLNNHCGAAAPLDDSMRHARCAKPFRELSVRWDGNVAICCNDWRGVYRCGNVVDDGLLSVWHGEAMSAARRILMSDGRSFAPCAGCNAVSYRVGLLPDKMGKVKLPRPTREDGASVARALSAGPLTDPVSREWEK